MHSNLKLLSYNSQLTLHGCPRKFQLYRMLKKQLAEGIDRRDIHTDFGGIVGFGVQHWLFTKNINRTKMLMLTKWQRELEEDTEKKQGKTFFHALNAVEKFPTFAAEEFGNYRLVEFEHKPALELGFIVDCGGGFYYRGYLDALLYDEGTQRFAVWEGKTTASNANEAMWANSAQGLSYSVVVDRIAQLIGLPRTDSYDVIYGVYKTKAREWEGFRIRKNYAEKAEWIQSLQLDLSILQMYDAADFYPKHGEHCYSFFRQCDYYGICGMTDQHLIGDVDAVEQLKEADERYDFRFTLEELIDTQLEKLEV